MQVHGKLLPATRLAPSMNSENKWHLKHTKLIFHDNFESTKRNTIRETNSRKDGHCWGMGEINTQCWSEKPEGKTPLGWGLPYRWKSADLSKTRVMIYQVICYYITEDNLNEARSIHLNAHEKHFFCEEPHILWKYTGLQMHRFPIIINMIIL